MLDWHVGGFMVSVININNDLKEPTYTRRSLSNDVRKNINMAEDSRFEDKRKFFVRCSVLLIQEKKKFIQILDIAWMK